MPYESAILIKVDMRMKKKMEEAGLNWSNEVRNFIQSRLKKRTNVALAVTLNEKILRLQKKSSTDTTTAIRKFRDTRYGANRS